MSDTGTYLYALTRPSTVLPDGPIGIGGSALRLLARDGLAGVVSTVDLADFEPGALAHQVEDLAWLERVAREHDAVVQAVAGPVLPLRLGAVYRDDGSALRRMAELRIAALAALDLVTDREEWGVKLFAIPRQHADIGAGADRPATGVEYLKRRRAELDRDAVAAAQGSADADAVFTRLGALAVRAHRHRPQDPALSGVAHPMVLNAAFLVDCARVAEFHAAVDALVAERPEGALVRTGPWAPYSFASLEGE
jgi:hypothetical protein